MRASFQRCPVGHIRSAVSMRETSTHIIGLAAERASGGGIQSMRTDHCASSYSSIFQGGWGTGVTPPSSGGASSPDNPPFGGTT